MKLIIATLLVFLSSPALAQDVSGSARAVDGDSLDFGGIDVRLHGIDAPELSQICGPQDARWACGKTAAGKLAALVAGRQLACQQQDIDPHGRIVARCRAGGNDIAGAMVDAGLAVALPDFTDSYIAREARARAARQGIWAGPFERPADYRAAHPRPAVRSSPPRGSAPRGSAPPPRTSSPGVSYRNCKEAWAAGAAPLYRGQPGYRPEMDGDGDGIACEPFRRR